MRNFIYRCPTGNLNVQGSVKVHDAEGKEFVAQMCLACDMVHIVSPVTGKLVSER